MKWLERALRWGFFLLLSLAVIYVIERGRNKLAEMIVIIAASVALGALHAQWLKFRSRASTHRN